MKFDNTPNVRSEAANSLSLFGRYAASDLVLTFFQDDHWLVRRSILAVLLDMECKSKLFEVCMQALATGEWGVDVVETQSAESFLMAMGWEEKTAGKSIEDVFKVERRKR
jgi:HEAT repeat protein